MPDALSFELGTLASVPSRLVEQARVDAESVGYLHGWAQGQRAAHAASATDLADERAEHERFATERDDRLQSALTALATAARQLEAAAVPATGEIEDVIIDSAIELAQALLGRELRDTDVAARAALARVLRLAPEGEAISVSLNPQDYATLAQPDSDGAVSSCAVSDSVRATMSATAGHEITLIPDASLRSGDCLARSGATTIDARLSEGVKRLREQLGR